MNDEIISKVSAALTSLSAAYAVLVLRLGKSGVLNKDHVANDLCAIAKHCDNPHADHFIQEQILSLLTADGEPPPWLPTVIEGGKSDDG